MGPQFNFNIIINVGPIRMVVNLRIIVRLNDSPKTYLIRIYRYACHEPECLIEVGEFIPSNELVIGGIEIPQRNTLQKSLDLLPSEPNSRCDCH